MTTTAPLPLGTTSGEPPLRYGALIAMMAMSFLLVTAEFLPNGLLTDISDELGVTAGQAGQMVTVTALAGLIAAPTVGLAFPRLDRRALLVALALAAAASNLVVAVAPTLPLLLLSRLLLGAAISGFWAMSITVAARIAGPARLGRAVMFTSAGASLATVAGVPLGVMLGEALHWRGVFALAAVASLLLAAVLRMLLPSVPADSAASLSSLFEAVRRPGIALGLAGHVLVVLGHFLAYTYIRLALDRVRVEGAPIDAELVILLLSVFGAGGLLGNVVIGMIIDRTYRLLSVVTPLVIAVATLGVIVGSSSPWSVAVVALVWGFFFSSWILIVNTWVGHRMPDRLEAGGSIVVVGFQGAIMVAAGAGGVLLDTFGIEVVYIVGAAALVLGALLFGLSNRAVPRG